MLGATKTPCSSVCKCKDVQKKFSAACYLGSNLNNKQHSTHESKYTSQSPVYVALKRVHWYDFFILWSGDNSSLKGDCALTVDRGYSD